MLYMPALGAFRLVKDTGRGIVKSVKGFVQEKQPEAVAQGLAPPSAGDLSVLLGRAVAHEGVTEGEKELLVDAEAEAALVEEVFESYLSLLALKSQVRMVEQDAKSDKSGHPPSSRNNSAAQPAVLCAAGCGK